MKNEYLILYGIADLLAHHFITNNLASLDKEGNLYFNPDDYKKMINSDKKLSKMLNDILIILSNKFSYEAFTGVKNKWNKLLNGYKKSKLFKDGYLPVFLSLNLLLSYAKYTGNKIYNTKPKTVKKTLSAVINERGINIMEKYSLNSLILSEKLFKEITK